MCSHVCFALVARAGPSSDQRRLDAHPLWSGGLAPAAASPGQDADEENAGDAGRAAADREEGEPKPQGEEAASEEASAPLPAKKKRRADGRLLVTDVAFSPLDSLDMDWGISSTLGLL